MPPKSSTTNRRTAEGIYAESIAKFPGRLVIISEGDSWFSYPLNRNLADYVEMMSDFSMLRLEQNGDEARDMLKTDGTQFEKLRKFLKRYPVELLIFSGGGNDVVDKNLPPLLRKKANGMTWRDCVNDAALDKRMAEIDNAYRNLIALRDRTRQLCEIVVHSYDYAVPDGRPAAGPFGLGKTGPWIKPSLDKSGITVAADAAALVRHLIDTFHARVAALAAPGNRFHVVDMRNTLGANHHLHWHDEMHPTGTGFGLLAEKWRATLKALFPGRGFEKQN